MTQRPQHLTSPLGARLQPVSPCLWPAIGLAVLGVALLASAGGAADLSAAPTEGLTISNDAPPPGDGPLFGPDIESDDPHPTSSDQRQAAGDEANDAGDNAIDSTIDGDTDSNTDNDDDVSGTEPVGRGTARTLGDNRVRRTDTKPASGAPDAWPAPQALLEMLKELRGGGPRELDWSAQTEELLEQLVRERACSTITSRSLLAQLEQQVHSGNRLADQLASREAQSTVRRAAYALQRRLDVWRAVHAASQPAAVEPLKAHVASIDKFEMARIGRQVAQRLAQEPNGAGWVEFLLLEQVRETAESSAGHDAAIRQELASRVLRAILKANLNPAQAEFLATEPLIRYQEELRRWATHTADYPRFLSNLEQLESQRVGRVAEKVTKNWINLHLSLDQHQRQVARAFDTHYRNANVRIAVTESMLNRLVPELPHFTEPVRENVLETQVTGQSVSSTRLQVKLLPDDERMRLLLEASGQMHAATTSRKGPVTLFNRNQSDYVVKRLVIMDRDGIHLGNTNAAASGDTRLVGLRTMYDRMPLIGSIVRNVARRAYDEQRGIARRLMVNRVTSQASQRLEQAMDAQLTQAQRTLQQRVIQPLEQLELDPTTMEMTTTKDRLVLRSRLASDTQLAAFTPRPRALAGSLLSVQLHESALNNFVEQLDMDGRHGTLEEIHSYVTGRIQENFGIVPKPVELDPGVQLKLADEDAVTVRCADGNVMISICFDYLAVQGRFDEKVYKRFTLQLIYHPHRDGTRAYLKREEGIRIAGRVRGRAALTAIFTRALPKDQEIELIDPTWLSDPRLADLQIGQLYVDHGWIGMSLIGTDTPTRVSERGGQPPARRGMGLLHR